MLLRSWEKARVLCANGRCATPQRCHHSSATEGESIFQCQKVCSARIHLPGTGTYPAAVSASVVVPLGRFTGIVMVKSLESMLPPCQQSCPELLTSASVGGARAAMRRCPPPPQGGLCGTGKRVQVKTSPLSRSALPLRRAWPGLAWLAVRRHGSLRRRGGRRTAGAARHRARWAQPGAAAGWGRCGQSPPRLAARARESRGGRRGVPFQKLFIPLSAQ